MSFFDTLQQQTAPQRQALWQNTAIIQRAINGALTREEYVAYLIQAYHHVKHTTPLLMAVGARLNERQEWLREAVAEYIEEELGHQEWILNDIAACGFDKEQVRNSQPNFSTEMMVAYAYDMVNRVHPLGFFGSVQVLEGTSIQLADNVADKIQTALDLPNTAFTYLRSHGALDVEHIKFFENLMNRITDQNEQAIIVHSAQRFYQLYRNIFCELETVTATDCAA